MARFVTPLLALLAALCLVAMATIAKAQQRPPCGPRAVIVSGLAERFKEVQAARAPTETNTLMELFISPEGSWTIIITNDQQMSCVAVGGTEGFEFVPPEVPKPGEAM
jgi:hypothetical protein